MDKHTRALDLLSWLEQRNLSKIQFYTITRESAPIYTIGNSMPVSFGRGKRGIAGQLLPYMVLNKKPLL